MNLVMNLAQPVRDRFHFVISAQAGILDERSSWLLLGPRIRGGDNAATVLAAALR